MKSNPDDDFPTFIARFEESYRKVLSQGETVSETHDCYQLLQCISQEFEYLIKEFDNLEESKFTFDYVKSKFLKETAQCNFKERQKQESLICSS